MNDVKLEVVVVASDIEGARDDLLDRGGWVLQEVKTRAPGR
jgi:hypothetical protein